MNSKLVKSGLGFWKLIRVIQCVPNNVLIVEHNIILKHNFIHMTVKKPSLDKNEYKVLQEMKVHNFKEKYEIPSFTLQM
jgi:hypothetical protein